MSAVKWIIAVASWFAFTTPASACLPTPMTRVREVSAAIVEGTFYVSDEAAGTGYIVPRLVEKGRRLRRYQVRWNPNEANELQPHELDCMVSIPDSGRFEIYYLAREGRRTFRIIGRAERARDDQ